MRALVFASLLIALPAGASEPPNARAAYVERRGLIEADLRCALFEPNMRAALHASAGQARGALLRAGWSRAQVGELEATVVAAARARACNDRRTQAAAADARAAFGHWLRANSLAFDGWGRAWEARRVAGSDGWRLRQQIAAPVEASFGVRSGRLTLVVPLARGQSAPTAARLTMRDPARAQAPEVTLQALISQGLQAGAPRPGQAAQSFAATRAIEPGQRGASSAVFTFPDAAFNALLALDPRESAEILLQSGARSQRLLIEVGDIAATRSFLAIGAP
jgi:hypothetical protein